MEMDTRSYIYNRIYVKNLQKKIDSRSPMDRTERDTIETWEFKYAIDQMYLTDIYRVSHSTVEYTFCSSAHRTLTQDSP